MGDFKLQVDVEAETSKLENGLKGAERQVEKSGKAIERSVDKVQATGESKFEKFAMAAAKVGAAVFAVEGALSLATAAVEGFSGDAEGMAEALASLPIIGGVADRAIKLAKALDEASDGSRELRQEAFQLADAFHTLAGSMGLLDEYISTFEEYQRLIGGDEIGVIEEVGRHRLEMLEQQHELNMKNLRKEQEERLAALEEESLDRERYGEEARRILGEIYEREQAEERMFRRRVQIAELQDREKIREIEAAREADRQAKLAERQVELDAEAEAHHQAMLEIEKERAAEEAARLAAAEEARKTEEAFLEKKNTMEKEIAASRAEAQAAVQGATASFSTAGGSFTTAISAQVNEAKVLSKISQQSRDFLAQIVANTARMGVGFA